MRRASSRRLQLSKRLKMTESEKMLYKKWAYGVSSELLAKEYNKVKKMRSTDASEYMKKTCEEERKYRDKIIGIR